MPSGLVKLNHKEVIESLLEVDARQVKTGEHYFRVVSDTEGSQITDPLVDVEISLRRGERVGLFVKGYAGKRKG